MGYTIAKILNSFVNNSRERLSTSNRSFNLIDGELYSYGEKIAFREDDDIHVYNKTAKGWGFYSMTTSNHLSKLLNCLMKHQLTFTLHNQFIPHVYDDDESDEEL